MCAYDTLLKLKKILISGLDIEGGVMDQTLPIGKRDHSGPIIRVCSKRRITDQQHEA